MTPEHDYLELWLVRHGETEWNRAKRLQGHSDVELNGRGEAQASALAGRVAGITFDAVYASDLQRARRTAEIAFPDQRLLLEPSLREMSLGDFEGRVVTELQGPELELWSRMKAGDSLARPANGESYADVMARVGAWLDALPASGRYACVTHGGVVASFLWLVQDRLKPAFTEPWPNIANVSVTVLRFAGETASLVLLNDHAHLDQLTAAD
ncbi:MAG TPA: histidine phosphatase family protein [Trueperaceae bacterium]|nr:histidine phosphatase family protein [Trueperaceae bacterium]